jgi:hypothetical protein
VTFLGAVAEGASLDLNALLAFGRSSPEERLLLTQQCPDSSPLHFQFRLFVHEQVSLGNFRITLGGSKSRSFWVVVAAPCFPSHVPYEALQ